MKYIYYDQDKNVKMIADNAISAPGLACLEITLTDEQEAQIYDRNYDKKIVNNELIITPVSN